MSSEVVRAIEISEFAHSQTTVSKCKLDDWEQSSDENVLGLLLHAVTVGWERIQPPLSCDEYGDLLLKVFNAAVENKTENKTSYARSPYEVGHLLAACAVQAITLVGSEPRILQVFGRLKEVLARLYRTGNGSQRRCIIDAVLEHSFENPELLRFFADWQSQSDLLDAFNEAQEWAERITRKRSLLRRVAESVAQQLVLKSKIRAMREPEVGTDTIVLEFNEPIEARTELVIDCDDELIASAENLDRNEAPQFIARLANYVSDSAHWAPGEHLATQWWVVIRESEGNFMRNKKLL
jgi:hypothetical protein